MSAKSTKEGSVSDLDKKTEEVNSKQPAMTPRNVYVEFLEVARALCADDPNQACREMADSDGFGQVVADMRTMYLHDFDNFKQICKEMSAEEKAKLLWHFVTAWIWLDSDGAEQTNKKNKGGSHGVANS